jgi:ketosteroid isomerase-like protein
VKQLYASRRKASAEVVGGVIHSLGQACASGGLIYEWGEGEVRTRSTDGKVVSRRGPYLTVWKRTGGTWRIIRNMAF